MCTNRSRLYETSVFSDIILRLDDSTMQGAHKIILRSRSKWFAENCVDESDLEIRFPETRDNHLESLVMQLSGGYIPYDEICAYFMDMMIRFCYLGTYGYPDWLGGDWPLNMSVDMIMNVLGTIYEIESLQKLSADRLMEKFDMLFELYEDGDWP